MKDRLLNSLMRHRGNMLSDEEMKAFHVVADQIAEIGFTDAMVCYNDGDDPQIVYDLVMKENLVVHITQYFTDPVDQIVYHIEKDHKPLFASHLPIDNFKKRLKSMVGSF